MFPSFRRMEHAQMHAKHKGHEAMHAEMVLILIVTLVVAQLVLVQWKQRHSKSYNVRQPSDLKLFESSLYSWQSDVFLKLGQHMGPGSFFSTYSYCAHTLHIYLVRGWYFRAVLCLSLSCLRGEKMKYFTFKKSSRRLTSCLHLLNPLLVYPVAGDPVPDVGSSSLLYYQTSLVEVPDHLVYLLCHHSLRLLPRHPQAAGVHHTEVNLQLYLETSEFCSDAWKKRKQNSAMLPKTSSLWLL